MDCCFCFFFKTCLFVGIFNVDTQILDTPVFYFLQKHGQRHKDLNYNYFRGTPDFNVQRAYGKMRGHHRTGSGEFTAYKMEDRLVAALGYFKHL